MHSPYIPMHSSTNQQKQNILTNMIAANDRHKLHKNYINTYLHLDRWYIRLESTVMPALRLSPRHLTFQFSQLQWRVGQKHQKVTLKKKKKEKGIKSNGKWTLTKLPKLSFQNLF